MRKKYIGFIFVLSALFGTLNAQNAAWYSKLYPQQWTPGYTYRGLYFLHDFSYAGYMKGEQEPPSEMHGLFVNVTQTPYNADNTGTNDATAAIQNAIDAVANAGGGTVYLPAGTYKVCPQGSNSSALSISHSNILFKGDGIGETFIRCYAENMRGKKIISVGAGGNWDSSEDDKTYYLSKDVSDTPSKEIYLNDIGNLAPNDWVIIRSDRSAEWIAELSMGGFWNPDPNMGTTFYRMITAIDRVNKSITIDIPTRYPLKMRDNARVYKVTPRLQNVGLQDFSIGNKMNPATEGWGEEDYNSNTAYGGYQVHGAFLIQFAYAINSWAKNIASYDAGNPSNTTFGIVHFSSNGLDLSKCRGITVENCNFSYPQYEGGGGNGYGVNLCAEDCFFKNYTSTSPRHAFAFKYAYANGNVFYDCTSIQAKYASDFHMYFSMSNLIDNYNLNGDFIESSIRPYGANVGNYHGYTSSQTVFWNTNGIAYKSGSNYIIDSRQYGYGYIVGTRGAASAVKTTPTVLSSAYGTVDTAPEDYTEGVGLGASLSTPSLYYSQLEKRLARENTATLIPAQIEAENFVNASNMRVEDSDNGFSLTDRQEGAWAEYRINVPTAAKYKVNCRVSGATLSGSILVKRLSSALGTIELQPTSSYRDYADNFAEIYLPEGIHTLRLVATGANFNIDRIEFETTDNVAVASPNPSRKVFGKNGQLFVSGYPSDALLNVYNNCGQKFGVFAAYPQQIEIPSGIYIVKVLTQKQFDSYKVIIN